MLVWSDCRYLPLTNHRLTNTVSIDTLISPKTPHHPAHGSSSWPPNIHLLHTEEKPLLLVPYSRKPLPASLRPDITRTVRLLTLDLRLLVEEQHRLPYICGDANSLGAHRPLGKLCGHLPNLQDLTIGMRGLGMSDEKAYDLVSQFPVDFTLLIV